MWRRQLRTAAKKRPCRDTATKHSIASAHHEIAPCPLRVGADALALAPVLRNRACFVSYASPLSVFMVVTRCRFDQFVSTRFTFPSSPLTPAWPTLPFDSVQQVSASAARSAQHAVTCVLCVPGSDASHRWHRHRRCSLVLSPAPVGRWSMD